MNRKTTIFTVFIVASLLLVGVTWTVYGIRREFQHELFDGEEAISFIATDHLLSRQWLECGLGEDESRIVRVVAARGVLQSGSRFCATVRTDEEGTGQIATRYTLRNDNHLVDSVLNVDMVGRQFQVSPRVGHDGAEIIVVMPDNQTGTVVYYAYAGDG